MVGGEIGLSCVRKLAAGKCRPVGGEEGKAKATSVWKKQLSRQGLSKNRRGRNFVFETIQRTNEPVEQRFSPFLLSTVAGVLKILLP